MLLQLQSCYICLNFGFIKNSICYFPLWQKKCLFITEMVLVFLEDSYLPCIHLDMKSTAFVVGTLLNTTNTERFSIVMFSWQPFSAFWFTALYTPGGWDPNWMVKNTATLTSKIAVPSQRERSNHNIPDFNKHHKQGMSLVKIYWRHVIFKPMVFRFIWAKQKWKFMRDRCKLSFPLPLAALLLALLTINGELALDFMTGK